MLITILALAHAWYPEACCGGRDCHPVPCAEISKVSDGWLWRHGADAVFFAPLTLHVSPDGLCHVCVPPQALTGGCLFLAPQT